jgi:hypothetical protein
VKDVLGVGSVQLGADSTVKLLQRVVQSARRLLIGVLLLAARVPSLLSLNADRISVVRHAPGGNRDAPAAKRVQLDGQRTKFSCASSS